MNKKVLIMVFLKEDGSLDIERINNLPIEEYWDMMGELTETQVIEYNSKLSLNESNEPMKALIVTKPIEQYGVDADEVLNNLKEMCRKDDTILHQGR
jgi:hypothetical protein